ncbi:MAG: hypothetical protein OXC31_07395, partial [Spirochaetaceae bacterium]|nr:hypothetical protein [Spirochaetaceae bacterium]
AATFVAGAGERLRFRYVVQAGDDSGGGVISFAADALRLNGATITDAAGRPLGSGSLTLASARVVQGDMVDGTLSEPAAPRRAAVVSAPQADRTYRRGEHILVEVRFDTGVTVTGSPRLELAIDNAAGAVRYASFVSAEHDTLRFRYDVQADDRDEDGIAIPTDALGPNGGAIRGSGGAAASLGLDRAEIVVPLDTVDGRTTERTRPTVRSVTVRSMTGASAVSVEVRFSEEVTVTGSPQLALRIGSAIRTAGLSARPAPDTVAFAHTLQSGDDASAGIGVPANAIRLNGGSIRDGVGNDAVLDSSEVLPSAGQAAGPGVSIACKQPVVSGAGRTLQAASAGSGDGIADYEVEVTLELEEQRDGSEQPVELGCVALASTDRSFSYSITRGDTSRFTVGAADGALRYVGSGESAARTTAHLLTVTATPDDGGAALHLAVRVVIVATDGGGPARLLQIGLAGFARTVAASAVQAIGQRFTPAARSAAHPDAMDVDVTLNGRTLDLAGAEARGELAADVAEALGIRVQDARVSWDAPSGAEFIAGSAFSAGGRWGVWGSGDLSGFNAAVDGFEQEAAVLSGFVGADYRFAPNALAGLAGSYTDLELTSTSAADGEARLEGWLVHVYPYGLWMPERLLGGKSGAWPRLRCRYPGGWRRRRCHAAAVLTWASGAAGKRAGVVSAGCAGRWPPKSDGVRDRPQHHRGAAEGKRAHALRARVLVEAGWRGGPGTTRVDDWSRWADAWTAATRTAGLGAEAGAELSYTDTSFGSRHRPRAGCLLVHEAPNLRDWGGGRDAYPGAPDGATGMAGCPWPTWGTAGGAADCLRRDGTLMMRGRRGSRLRARAGRVPWLPEAVTGVSPTECAWPTAGRLGPFAQVGAGMPPRIASVPAFAWTCPGRRAPHDVPSKRMARAHRPAAVRRTCSSGSADRWS